MYLCMQKKKKKNLHVDEVDEGPMNPYWSIQSLGHAKSYEWITGNLKKSPLPLKHDGNLFRLIKRHPDWSLLSSHSHTHTQKDGKPNGTLWESFWKFNLKLFPIRSENRCFFLLFFSFFFLFLLLSLPHWKSFLPNFVNLICLPFESWHLERFGLKGGGGWWEDRTLHIYKVGGL